jgi:hypothetical protein
METGTSTAVSVQRLRRLVLLPMAAASMLHNTIAAGQSDIQHRSTVSAMKWQAITISRALVRIEQRLTAPIVKAVANIP